MRRSAFSGLEVLLRKALLGGRINRIPGGPPSREAIAKVADLGKSPGHRLGTGLGRTQTLGPFAIDDGLLLLPYDHQEIGFTEFSLVVEQNSARNVATVSAGDGPHIDEGNAPIEQLLGYHSIDGCRARDMSRRLA